MTKRELIDEIVTINRSASPEFLATFREAQLSDYLEHLQVLKRPRLTGNARRFEKYFAKSASAARSAQAAQVAQVAQRPPKADPPPQPSVKTDWRPAPAEPALAGAPQSGPTAITPFATQENAKSSTGWQP